MANERMNILRFLIEHQDRKFSIRQLSKEREVNYKSAYQAVMRLERSLVLERHGNITLCSFNRHLAPEVFEVEWQRRNDLLKDKALAVLADRMAGVLSPSIVLMFGSRVKGTASKKSDIDLLIIAENPSEIERIASITPLPLHIMTVTPKEFVQMADSREFSVVSEAIRKNVILVGIEEYYRLLDHGRKGRESGE